MLQIILTIKLFKNERNQFNKLLICFSIITMASRETEDISTKTIKNEKELIEYLSIWL